MMGKFTTRSNPKHYAHNREHWCRAHGRWKEKKSYDTEEEALAFLRHLPNRDDYRAYRCPICGKWHLGYSRH